MTANETTTSTAYDPLVAETNNLTRGFDPYEVVAFLLVHCPAAVIVDRAITPVWYAVGVVGNVLSARIWLQRRMWQSNSSAIYLSAISFVDLAFVLLHVVMELKYAWAVHSFRYPIACEVYYVLFMATQYLSPTLVLCFTVERYIAVCHPFRKEQFCTCERAVRVVAAAVASCTSLALIQGYFYVYDPSTTDCVLRESIENGDHLLLWTVWTWTTETTVFLVVPFVILVFNVFVILEVRKVSRLGRKNLGRPPPPPPQPPTAGGEGAANGSASATTVMLLSVSFYVILTTLPATLVYVLMADVAEGDHDVPADRVGADPDWSRYLNYILGRKIVDELCLSHYACNFVLYVVTGAHFRRSLLELLGCAGGGGGGRGRRWGGGGGCGGGGEEGGHYSEVTQKTEATNARTTHF